MIADDGFSIEFDSNLKSGAYSILLEKKEASKASIHFFAANTYYLDLYPGELSSNDGIQQKSFVSDLMMDVAHVSHGPKYSKGTVISIVLLAFFVSTIPLLAQAYGRKKRRTKTV